MFDPITEKLIKDIPQFDDIDVERLPQLLSSVYAHIISAKSQLANGQLPLLIGDFDETVRTLNNLIFGLEALMIQVQQQGQVESLAFVTATAYSLKNMLLQQKEESIVSMDYVSADVSTVLLFLIADAVTDAVEVARKFHKTDGIQGNLLRSIRLLAEGKLNEIVDSEITKEEFHGDYQEYAINLLMNELCEGIKDIALHFLGNTNIKPTERLEQVLLLSSYQIEEFDQIDTYVGIRKIARLLLGVTKHLEQAALIHIPVPEGVDAERWKSFLHERCMHGRPFIWKNHGFAIYNRFLDLGVSSIFTYPTGAGKSTIVQLKIASSILADRRVIVLVPTHALESQMKRELSAIFKENFSQQMFAGGEFSEYFVEENKQEIVVMTPERCLTVLGDASDKLNDVGLVVFDEFHLMGAQESGNDSRSLTAMFTMLEIFEKLPQVDFVLLSAMVKNSHDIADWLKSVTHRECLVFDDKWKPTRQLQGCLVYEQGEIKQLQNNARTNPQHKSKKKLEASMLATPWSLFCLKTVWDSQKVMDYSRVKLLNHQISLGISSITRKLTPNRNQVACQIASAFVQNGLRVMIFVDTPRSAQSIQKNAKDAIPLVDLSALFAQNQAKIDQLTLELGDFSYSYLLNQTSCAVHHGLLLPEERDLMEQSYRQEHGVHLIAATPTLAQGVNLPADVVIIAGYDRYDVNTGGRETLEAHEILNAAGRAGRAGFNSYGAVILIPNHVLAMQDNTIGNEWQEIKDGVFAGGDQCFVIKDPIERMVDAILNYGKAENRDEEILLYRLGDDEKTIKRKLSHSFGSYLRRKENKEPLENDSEALARLVQSDEKDIFLQNVSVKYGVNMDSLSFIQKWLDEQTLDVLIGMRSIELVGAFFELTKTSDGILESLMANPTVFDVIKGILQIKEENSPYVGDLDIDKLKDLTIAYMEGKNFLDISELLPQSKGNDHLKNVRRFVLSVIPSVSYAIGIFSKLLKRKADDENVHIDGDILFLATIVKEGVISASMLRYKEKHFLMRVACHEEYLSLH